MSKNKKISTFFIFIILTFACVPTLPTTSAPVPTFDANLPLTAIIKTAAAAATQTQQFAPPTLTSTATSTRTPLPTETASPTFVFALPTSTVPPTQIKAGSSGLDLDCQIISQDPPANALISTQSQFTAIWIVANVGLKAWPSDNTDYRYFNGASLHLQPIYDFEQTVAPDDTVELIVAMQAPNQPGVYTTSWRISIGQERFCNMNISIIVG